MGKLRIANFLVTANRGSKRGKFGHLAFELGTHALICEPRFLNVISGRFFLRKYDFQKASSTDTIRFQPKFLRCSPLESTQKGTSRNFIKKIEV